MAKPTYVANVKSKEKKEMNEKVKEIQNYLKRRSINASETAIIDAAIEIATQLDGNAIFEEVFLKREEEGNE